jgi:hypothetical protein
MVGGRRAFGYSADGLELDPIESPLVAQLYKRFLAGGTLTELTAWLNEQGVSTPRGLRWTVPSVRVVLANPRNAGRRGIRRVLDHKTGRRSPWHELIGAGVWPPIVTEAEWEIVVTILQDPLRSGRVNNSRMGNQPKYLLTNIAKCGTCDAGMVNSWTGRIRILRCRFGHHSRRADYIEAYVEEVLLSRLSRSDATELLAAKGPGVDVEGARAEAAVLRTRLAGLAADYGDGVLDRDQMRVASERIRSRMLELGAALVEVGQVDPVAALIGANEGLEEVWGAYPLSTQRAVVDKLMAIRVLRGRSGSAGRTFDPDTVEIVWREPR